MTHESLRPGDPCPNCKKGTVYESVEPGHLVRIRGRAPLGATVYEVQKLRCNLCGAIFTARTPPRIGSQKYDAESASMIALLKYGTGLPFNRPERLAFHDIQGDRNGYHALIGIVGCNCDSAQICAGLMGRGAKGNHNGITLLTWQSPPVFIKTGKRCIPFQAIEQCIIPKIADDKCRAVGESPGQRIGNI